MNHIWSFNCDKNPCPAGLFSSKSDLAVWIKAHQLTGYLALYPVDISVYDWALKHHNFKINKEEYKSPKFIQTFSSASQVHYHYEAGICRPGHDEEVVQHQSFNPGQLWVFLGIDSDFPAAVFSERDKAESWINRYKLNGNVILYPVDITLYDRAIQNNYISGDNPEVSTKEFISNYTPDRLKQLVYQEGILKGHIQHDGKRQNYFTV